VSTGLGDASSFRRDIESLRMKRKLKLHLRDCARQIRISQISQTKDHIFDCALRDKKNHFDIAIYNGTFS
jgi:hypothetical protein